MKVNTPPRITCAYFNHVLQNNQSPARVVGEACYLKCVEYGLDPAIALAFFAHESGYGRYGIARTTHNWGNIRPAQWLVDTGLTDGSWRNFLMFSRREGEQEGGEWVRSLEVWCILIRDLYIDKWGLWDHRAILRKYAPTADGNVPESYAKHVEQLVIEWVIDNIGYLIIESKSPPKNGQ